MISRLLACVGLSCLVVVGLGCAGETKRLGADEASEIEVGTGMTSQDFRAVCLWMARSLVQRPQIQNATTPPKIAFLTPKNNTSDYLDTEAFLNKMRTELLKHSEGKFVFLDRAIVAAIEKENRDKDLGRRTSGGEKAVYGADFFLTGVIESIDKATNKGRTEYIRYSFRLTDAATTAIVWEEDKEFKKYSRTPFVYR